MMGPPGRPGESGQPVSIDRYLKMLKKINI